MEAAIETRLAHEIEDPVHKFISKFDDPTWEMNHTQREQMAKYVSLLFNRTEARKAGSKHLLENRGQTERNPTFIAGELFSSESVPEFGRNISHRMIW